MPHMPHMRLGVVSTYVPREDGLATFTHDLLDAILAARPGTRLSVAAITAPGATPVYPREVRWQIRQGVPSSYAEVGRALSRESPDLVLLQHEFTLYGRWDEAHVRLEDYTPWLLDALDRPIVTTLHTVLPQPDMRVREAVQRLYDRSVAMVVMADMAVKILGEDYALDPVRLRVMPHGVPELPPFDSAAAKHELGLAGRTVLCTFGLLRRSKGIEVAIRALPAIVDDHPEVIYLVVGATHPEVRKQEGEAYREELMTLAHDLGVRKHVRFVGGYLAKPSLMRYLQATDIYITPYHDREQITSGTLAYALGFGHAIVSTPYIYAVETLAEGRGLLAEFNSPESIARCLRLYLDEPMFMRATRERARAYGRAMSWPRVGSRYAELLERVALGKSVAPASARVAT